MAYCHENFKSKKALKEALKNGPVQYYQPALGPYPMEGVIDVEGPHYPAPHSWYAKCRVENGLIVEVLK